MPKCGNTTWVTCVICHKMYTHKTNLKRHIKSAHENIRHHCQWCPSIFKRREYMTRHIRTTHPEKMESSSSSPHSSGPLRSTSTQTELCRLATTPSVQHIGTNTKPCLSKDKSVGTTVRTAEQATSPVEWGCHSREAQLQEETTQATASYKTATADDWTQDLSTVEEYFTSHCSPAQNTPDELSSVSISKDTHEGFILDFDLDLFE